MIVFAILVSSTWGFVQPRNPPKINGTEITPLGFSPAPFMLLGGVALLWAFGAWEQRRARLGQDQLLDTTLLRIAQLRAGLETLVGQQLVLMGTFFCDPRLPPGRARLRRVRDRQAPAAPVTLHARVRPPGPRIAARRSPRAVARLGLVTVSIGAVVMLATLDVKLNDDGFKIALALIGAGAGLLASQLGNVIMSSVGPTQTGEAGGLQGMAQNLGSSLGTAIIGAVLLAALATGFNDRITDNPDVPAAAQKTITANDKKGIDIVPVADVEKAGEKGGLSPGQAQAVADDYGDAQLDALRLALGAVAVAVSLSLAVTRGLPTGSLAEAPAPAERAKAIA